MATFVLVPGFWLGAWAWEGVARSLRAAGHEVHPVTLTGLGDRAHLASRDVDLETHVTDVVNVIVYAGLREVVRVGHSGGGQPIAGAADRIPERIAHAVYLESGPLPDGMAQIDTHPPDARKRVEAQIAEQGDGWRIPVPAWDDPAADPVNLAGLGPAELTAMRARAMPQPARTSTDSLRRSHRVPVPETLVACTFPEDAVRQMLAEKHPMFSGFAGNPRVVALPTGHWPMFSRPDDTARVLAEIAGGA
ncbi:MAG: alpha/beta fold hydrolase [Chloroflexota bacterium]